MDRLLSADVIYALIGALVVLGAVLWPVPVRGVGRVDVFGLDLHLTLSMLFGRFDVKTNRRADGEVDVVVEISVFHLLAIRRKIVGGLTGQPPTSKNGETTGAGDASNSDRAASASRAATTYVEGGSAWEVWTYTWHRWNPVARGVWSGTRFLLHRVRVRRLRLQGAIGLGEAARTAQAYGVFWSGLGVAGARLQKLLTLEEPPYIMLSPAYNQWLLRFEGEGTMMIRLGDAFLAGILALWEFVRRWARGRRPSRIGLGRNQREVEGAVGEGAHG